MHREKVLLAMKSNELTPIISQTQTDIAQHTIKK